MFLAVREMRRSVLRFSMLTIAVGLLVFLVLFQTSIRDGLVTTFVGGIENQTAPVMVLSTDAIRDLNASVIQPATEARVRAVDGVGVAGRIGLVTAPAVVGGKTTAVSVFGFQDARVGAPSTMVAGRLPSAPGEVVASEGDATEGFTIGARVRVLPAGTELVIVGQARDIDIGLPTLFGTFATYGAVARGANPYATADVSNAIALAPAPGVSAAELASNVNATGTDLDALGREKLASSAPGVSQVKTSFLLIFIIFAIVSPLITGLFFLIVTFQKAGSLTLLRALGVRSGVLVRSLLGQVLVVVAAGVLLGIAMYVPLSTQRLGTISLKFGVGAVVFWSTLFIVLGVASALTAARRVLAIDPVEATTGAGGGL